MIDPETGTATRIPADYAGDLFYPDWTRDGRVVASAVQVRSSLWRFTK